MLNQGEILVYKYTQMNLDGVVCIISLHQVLNSSFT